MSPLELFSDYTFRTVAAGAAALGIASGALGCFAVLRKQSLLGDAISHAALPGIVLAFLITGTRAPLGLVIGAALAGWVGTLVVTGVVRHSRISEDSALGIVLAVFFGFGLVLLTVVQRRPDAGQAGLDRFLFGQAATVLERDVEVIAVLGALCLLVMVLAWKEFKLLSFDADFAHTLGMQTHRIQHLLTAVLVVAIVIGLQMVGVVLMSAMVVAPAAVARQWTNRLGTMVALAGFFGALAGVSGAVISSTMRRIPTGPTIVLCLTALVLLSLTFAPGRGLLWEGIRRRRNRNRLRVAAVLGDLYILSRQHSDISHGHPLGTLEAMRAGRGSVRRSLGVLQTRGLADRRRDGTWTLTEAGYRRAEAQSQQTRQEGAAATSGEDDGRTGACPGEES